jgi:hypothetical protein
MKQSAAGITNLILGPPSAHDGPLVPLEHHLMLKGFSVFKALCIPALLCAASAHAELMVGLVPGNSLVYFDSAAPGAVGTAHAVSGITAGQTVGAIALRQADKEIYGLGVFGTSVQLYRIDMATYQATAISMELVTTSTSGNFSLDVNPVTDVVRVVSDSGTNMRLNPTTGAFIGNDSSLTFAPMTYDGTPAATAIAYSNNFSGASSTTLYALEYKHDRLFTIGGLNASPSPNTGVMTEVGAIGLADNQIDMGFDISPQGNALAILTPGSVPALYQINLLNGVGTLVGVFPVNTPMRDLVFASSVPELDPLFKNGFEP